MYMNRSMDDNTAPPCRADRKKYRPAFCRAILPVYYGCDYQSIPRSFFITSIFASAAAVAAS